MHRFQQQDILEITHGQARLRVAPQAGGRLLSWETNGIPVIHWPDPADWNQPAKIRGGNPLLFPFLGRHRVDGRLNEWRDPASVVRDMPTHGFARDLPFSYTFDADNRNLQMALTDSEATHAAYPFAFRFEAAYQLVDENMLDVALTISNVGDVPLPYYAGHHFYFALPHGLRGESRVELPPSSRRYQDARGAISTPVPGDIAYSLDDPRIVDCFHCLSGVPAQPVRLVSPGLGRIIEIDLQRPSSLPWYAVTTWTETDTSDFYCVEPWLGLPDAIHNGLGLRWLAPGKTEIAALRIVVILESNAE
jgi:galactose mutarotase-like enzyme